MLRSRPTTPRWLACLLVCLMALSSQAWASHVHLQPIGDHSHAGASQVQDQADVADTTADQADDTGTSDAHSDHCCHAGAHLMGPLPDGMRSTAAPVRHAQARLSKAFIGIDHAPPIDPPIA